MQKSEQINELATALAKAQAEITGAKKGTENPFFRSKYADLAEVWDVIRGPLSKNGLSVVQFPSVAVQEDARVVVTTVLMHTSGQFISDDLALKPAKDDPQGVGSAITYARRYALAAAVGVAQEDDDGNAATHHDNNASSTVQAAPRKARAKPEFPVAPVNLMSECKVLADKLGIPAAARKAMADDAKGDFSKVKKKLEAALREKEQLEVPAEAQS